jgi:dihydroneopterin aldolase
MAQVVRLWGIRTEGRHGASSGETDAPQPFLIDLEIEVDAREDHIGGTGDYREAVAAARATVEGESVTLIETLARRVAAAVAAVPGVRSCRAVVHKPLAANRLGVSDVSAEATSG